MRTSKIMQNEFSECEEKRLSDNAKKWIINAINEARKEAIEECAKRFVIDAGECGEFGVYVAPSIEKNSVKQLINELK